MESKPFDLMHAPLSGTNLIESGAGTGKTFTIAGLFLRLILEKELSVEQILVVTFTKAATEELKERIRQKLLRAKISFATGIADDPLIDHLVKKHPDPHDAERRIKDALSEFDTAAIYTIHGFCQRVLFESAFETGSLFSTEVTTETFRMLQAVADDFWRKHLYDTPPEVIRYALHGGGLKSPSAFLDLLQRFDRSDIDVIPSPRPCALPSLEPFRRSLSEIRADWPAFRESCAQLLSDPGLKANVYGSLQGGGRRKKILEWQNAMDGLVDPSSVGFPLFKGFENLTSKKLIRATKKGQNPPAHPFFDRCTALAAWDETLKKEVEQCLISLRVRMFQFAAKELRVRKQDENVYFFHDLLATLKAALDRPGGHALIKAIRNRYKAALVDEFQDTDAVQYHIFSTLFAPNEAILFMIGDPKQAIYGFRGADIFSYLKAVRDAEHRYTLTANWRSEADLIAAVNALYLNTKTPFVFPEIPFFKGVPGNQRQYARGGETAMGLWYLDSETEKPMSKTEATRIIAAHVADEILHLIRGKARTRAGDIAVLVRTNRQAQIVKSHLSLRGVPAVLYQAGNIFDSHEAMEVERVLASVSEPRNERLFRAALATEIMGVSGEAMETVAGEDRVWEPLRKNFLEYLDMWRSDGFVRMFQRFLSRENVRNRLLSYPDGDRRLTNLMHIEELLQDVSTRRRLGPAGLIKWLSEQRDPDTPRLDAHQLRLESDADAVTIATIHKSKGLEYDTVFCPFAWEGSTLSGAPVVFHDPEAAKQICLDFGSERLETHKQLAQNELLSENLRLLYVALTRAKRKCYLVWGRIRGAETSALAYLFHYDTATQTPDVVSDLKNQMRSKQPDQLIADVHRLVNAAAGAISFEELPADRPVAGSAPPEQHRLLFGRHFNAKIDSAWRVSSYSALIFQHDTETESPDRDAYVFQDSSDADIAFTPTAFSFPKGVRAGLFFHDILEKLSPDDAVDDVKTVIREKLDAYGFDTLWEGVVFDTVRQVFSVLLPAGDLCFSLSDVRRADRIHEMEFYFPTIAVTPKKLQEIFSFHGEHRIPDGFPEKLGRLVYSPTAGFMKGYVDLVFGYQEKFFLIDWKSNYLGNRIEDYHQNALMPAMTEGYYFLQYYLYTLALDRYLSARVPGYRYDSHFGGVFYLFLRGIDASRGSEFGIFSDVPNTHLMKALRSALIPEH